jgi:hypothetical protein
MKRKVFDWSAQPLGVLPDHVIAKHLGVKTATVKMARRRRRIRSFRAQPDAVSERRCPKCLEVKPIAEFRAQREGRQWHAHCSLCRKESRRTLDARRWAAEGPRIPGFSSLKSWIDGLKSVPCMDCGGRFPPVAMDFDHREGEVKAFDISRAPWKVRSKASIEKEIAKCDVVCANCHRVRTQQRHESRRARRRRELEIA